MDLNRTSGVLGVLCLRWQPPNRHGELMIPDTVCISEKYLKVMVIHSSVVTLKDSI